MQKHDSRALYDLSSRLNSFFGGLVWLGHLWVSFKLCCSKNVCCIKYVPFLTCMRHFSETGNSGPTVYSHINLWITIYIKQNHVHIRIFAVCTRRCTSWNYALIQTSILLHVFVLFAIPVFFFYSHAMWSINFTEIKTHISAFCAWWTLSITTMYNDVMTAQSLVVFQRYYSHWKVA